MESNASRLLPMFASIYWSFSLKLPSREERGGRGATDRQPRLLLPYLSLQYPVLSLTQTALSIASLAEALLRIIALQLLVVNTKNTLVMYSHLLV